MLLIISSAKTMAGTSGMKVPEGTVPRFQEEANEIALHMAQYASGELRDILKINPQLAAENYLRFRDFHSTDTRPLPAILAYTGVVFKNISPDDFSAADLLFTQDTLRIASFCYGLLRPLDGIKPYRMEGDVKLPEAGDGNVHHYWREKLTPVLIDDIRQAGGVLINLAAADIKKAFYWKKVETETRVIIPDFKVWKNGQMKTIVVYAKMARGQMVRHVIKNRITDPERLKMFSWEGFRYNPELSGTDNWVFLQD